ncbi:MAG: DUF1488 domain-containing protein [Bauldia sp.]
MALSFPNHSRSYDAVRGRISFWGHDGALEIPFFLELNALFRLFPRTANNEAGILAAFDAGWNRICEIAGKAYSPGRRTFYVLGEANL